MPKKRNKLKIIYDILKVISNKNGRIKPTHIMYKSNLSYRMMNEYLQDLIKKEMISEVKKGNSKSYKIEKKGKEYLEKFMFVIEFTDSFGLN